MHQLRVQPNEVLILNFARCAIRRARLFYSSLYDAVFMSSTYDEVVDTQLHEKSAPLLAFIYNNSSLKLNASFPLLIRRSTSPTRLEEGRRLPKIALLAEKTAQNTDQKLAPKPGTRYLVCLRPTLPRPTRPVTDAAQDRRGPCPMEPTPNEGRSIERLASM